MAEIPVEKKSSMTWLWVLLGLILAALLLWWLLDDDDEQVAEPVAVESVEADRMTMNGADPAAVAAGTDQATAGGPVTQLGALIPAIAPQMVGQEVRLTNVPIQEVVSDIGFWIGPSADQRVFAVISEERSPQQPGEGIARVNEGATVDLVGTIRSRGEVLQGLAAGGNASDLPQGVDRFLVVSNYRTAGQTQ